MGLRVILTVLALGAAAVVADQELVAVVHLTSQNSEKYNVTGELKLFQATTDGPVYINGTVYGLTVGAHGFHVHQTGDLSNGCTSTGAHFNPDHHNHGAPTDDERHVGDLGNIAADANGFANVEVTDSIISLTGRNGILGRAIVVHSDADDMGRGGVPLSLTTGNAGDRVACGVIGILSPVDSWASNSTGSNLWSSSTFLISAGILAALLIQA